MNDWTDETSQSPSSHRLVFPPGPADAARRRVLLTNALNNVADDLGLVDEIKSWPDRDSSRITRDREVFYRHAPTPDADLFFDSIPRNEHLIEANFPTRRCQMHSILRIVPYAHNGIYSYSVHMETPVDIMYSMKGHLVIDNADWNDLGASITASAGFAEFRAHAITQLRIGFISSFIRPINFTMTSHHKGATFRYVEKDTKGTWSMFGPRKFHDEPKNIHLEFTPSCFALDSDTPRTFETAADFAAWATARRPPSVSAVLHTIERIVCAL